MSSMDSGSEDEFYDATEELSPKKYVVCCFNVNLTKCKRQKC